MKPVLLGIADGFMRWLLLLAFMAACLGVVLVGLVCLTKWPAQTIGIALLGLPLPFIVGERIDYHEKRARR